MSMPAFGNPVVGYIRRPGSPLLVGSFRVTSTFAEHVASGRGPGTDIGNGQCGAPLFSMHAGTVTLAGKLGTANVIRIRTDDGEYETGYAHLATIGTSVGVHVARGVLIGTLGSSGATACHLHIGCKQQGVEVDVWPLLEQVQQEANCDAIQGALTALQLKVGIAKQALA